MAHRLFAVTLMACTAGTAPRPGDAPPAPTEVAVATPVESASPPTSAAAAPPPVAPPASQPERSVPATQAPACRRLAVALVVDRSGSMTGAPLDAAKDGVRAAMGTLSKDDCVTVVAFDSVPARVVALGPPTPDGLSRVAAITAGGGTDLLGPLLMAHDDLALARSAKRRHVVLMTDGQAATHDLMTLAHTMADESMTLTTIALGSSADEPLLRSLADVGGGRFYKVADAQSLPRVFTREVEMRLQSP